MARDESASERRAAFEAMFRVRAVESPADGQGLRTVWHRPYDDVQLVTTIDAGGQIQRHELTMFGDVVRWERQGGVRTGARSTGEAPAPAAVDDAAPDAGKLAKAVAGLTPYAGDDRLITHLRELLVPVNPIALGPRPHKHGGKNRRRRALVLVALGAALLALALALFFAQSVVS